MRIVPALALCFGALVGADSASAQDYPCSQVRLVVPYPAGGATDVATRVVAERLEAVFKKPFFVENRGGATGNIGTVAVDQRTAGRLHAAGQRHRHRDLPPQLLQAVLRSVQGSGAGRWCRRDANADRGRPFGPRQRHQGPGRMEQDQARRPQLQHRRLRSAAASRDPRRSRSAPARNSPTSPTAAAAPP